MLARKLLEAAGNAGGESLYVEDVFSTYLYTGNNTSRTITNSIDLSGEGGLVWIKDRDTESHNILTDTERGATKVLWSGGDGYYNELTEPTYLTAFNSDGFSLGSGSEVNGSGPVVSWTFRKAEKFFDVVTYTGDGTNNRNIAHNLGSTPGCIIIKSMDHTRSWRVWHSGLTAGKLLELDGTGAESSSTAIGEDHTATTFDVNNANQTNWADSDYVAYLFASDAGGFGDDGSESIIKCEYTTATVGTWTDVNVGFEPQWVLIKNSTATGSYNSSGNAGSKDWYVIDTMRGATAATGSNTKTVALSANSSIAEYNDVWFGLTSTGFSFKGVTGGSDNFIYIAIRRPMKTPESGTEVFATDQGDATSTNPQYVSGFPVDMGISWSTAGGNKVLGARLIQGQELLTDLPNGEQTAASNAFDFQNGWYNSVRNTAHYSWMFKRATGFFDVVAWTASGALITVNHNLGVIPELIITKYRGGDRPWYVAYGMGATTWNLIQLDETAQGNSYPYDSAGFTSYGLWSKPTSTQMLLRSTLGGNTGDKMVAFLFATLAGVSKVGSYTGTAATLNVDCGFSAGARFIFIKRTDSTGDWYVYDSVRGIVAGNDPYTLLNNNAAQVTSTDYIDPLNAGFTVTSSAPAALNASGGTYIFLAIA